MNRGLVLGVTLVVIPTAALAIYAPGAFVVLGFGVMAASGLALVLDFFTDS